MPYDFIGIATNRTQENAIDKVARMPGFEYKGKTVHYTEAGSGPTLLLLHGNTASGRMFASIIGLYADDFHVIVPDFLGHGSSERLDAFPDDFWFDEAMQCEALLDAIGAESVDVIGTSGGALVAINLALECPNRVHALVADSFEGTTALPAIVADLQEQRDASKLDAGTGAFYAAMHGDDWESVVDNDTHAIIAHAQHIGEYFHKPLSGLKSEILLTGSEGDEFLQSLGASFYRDTFAAMLSRIGHGEMHLFPEGGHPAMLSNAAEFARIAKVFLLE